MIKIMRVGTVLEGNNRASVYFKAAMNEGKLSITGVIGPKSNGDAVGSCGQIDMGFKHRDSQDNDKRYGDHLIKPNDINFTKGWDTDKLYDFLDIWQKWHLNDMKANCVHQVGPEWTPQDVILYNFELNEETEKAVKKAKDNALQVLTDGKPFSPSKGQIKITALKRTIKHHASKLPKSISNYYQFAVKKYDWQDGPTETKSTSWLDENEHPKGYLSKACPVCGYKYGSAWNRVEVPQDVIDFVQSLPDTDQTPAWI